MRIAHCIHGLGAGGAQKVIASTIRCRQHEELRYFVYSCHDGVQRREIEDAGATVRIVSRSFAKLDPSWVVRLARTMRRDGVELVHTHLFGDSLHGYLAARLASRLPVVMTLHTGPEGLSRLQRHGYRWLLRRCARAVACSEAVATGFSERGLAPDRPQTIPNGVAPPGGLSAARIAALRSDLGAGPDTVLFAAVGRLAAEKGYGDLLDAFARLRPSTAGARLLIVGEGPLRAELESRAQALSLDGQVVFTGFRADVPELLQAVDVVVFSSLWEGLPMALLEAMAAGRCVVTTDVPGILEAVRAGREALVVPRGDAGGLAGALGRAAAEGGLRARLAAAARNRFLERFTVAAMVDGYERLYREVAAERDCIQPR